MANNANNVTTGKPNVSGAIWVAPKTAQAPTSASSELGSDYKCLGFVSEDGLENALDMNVEGIKAWGGLIVYRSLTELGDTFKFALIETMNVEAKKAAYGDANVTTNSSGDIVVDVKASDPEEKIWVFDLALRGNKAMRIVVPDGAVTEREAIKYVDGEAVAYGLTVSAYPDSNGSCHKEYTPASYSI